MNSRTILSTLVFAVLGLVIGYWLFGKFVGGHVSLSTLFNFDGNVLQSAFQSVSGIESMRNKILLCGVAGGVAGLLVSFKLKK